MLTLKHISKNFSGLKVLEDVNITVPEGCIYGLIGPNGAGKTTVFNLMTGLLKPSGGDILLNEQSIIGTPSHHITQMGLARTFQNIRIFKEMSLVENVVVGYHRHLNYAWYDWLLRTPRFRKMEQQAYERAEELLSWMQLTDKKDEIADNLSYGEQRRLELARALATDPKVLLLDEPVAGMNPAEKEELMQEILKIKAHGYTIFMIEHDMRFVMGLCDRISVLNFGRIIAEGVPEEIRTNPDVIEAYLGKEEPDEVSDVF